MPSETFLRLPEEKRTRFINAAWHEFTRVSFADASINQIIQKAGIPRGSFYQYFADKKALFCYLLESMMDYFLKEYCKMIDDAQGDFFETQLRCFDRVLLKKNTHPLFERGIQIMQLNLVGLTEAIAETQMAYRIWDATKAHIDLSRIRDGEEDLGRQAFVMSLVVLVTSMAEAMKHPEQVTACREALLTRLAILKNGTLR